MSHFHQTEWWKFQIGPTTHYKRTVQSRQLCNSWRRSSPPSLSGHRKAAWQTRCKFKPAQQVREGNAKCRWCTWLSAPGAQRQTLKTRVSRHCRTSCLYELFIKAGSERGPLVSYQETQSPQSLALVASSEEVSNSVTLHPLITRGTRRVSAPLLAEASLALYLKPSTVSVVFFSSVFPLLCSCG